MSQKPPPDSNNPQDISSDLEMARQSRVVAMDTTVAQLLDQAVAESDVDDRTGQPLAAKSYYVFISKCYVYINDC